MAIGEFSERSGLSAKRLRTYAAEGLLAPAAVDPTSGYRYYSPGQLADARVIDALRQANVALADIRAFIGDRRVTIVFDRGGWSPRLFQTRIADGFDILTYRKGRARKRLRWEFREHCAVLDGREIVYRLADHGIRLLGGAEDLLSAWDLEELSAEYRAFRERFAALRPRGREAVFRAQTELVHGWRRLAFLDPDLPAELLPRGWPRRHAYELFHRRNAAWHVEAQAYFALRDS